MISVIKAKTLISKNLLFTGSEILPLLRSLYKITSDDIIAPISHPMFDQSAVDGYGIRSTDVKKVIEKNKKLKVIGEIRTGDIPNFSLKSGQSVRIFTGAQIPPGCDSIIMQEDVIADNNFITFKKLIKKGANVRKKGFQIKKGEVSLEKGSKINSSSIGFLSSLGIKTIKVSKNPSVGIVVTGNEFDYSKSKLKRGEICESNSKILQSSLRGIGISSNCKFCVDDFNKLYSLVKKTANLSDITIITGGVSVGDYDFTKEVIQKLGFRIIFHNVNQKPGKPLLFAKYKDKVIFGLPGNPRSVLVCYYEYVYPFILGSMHAKDNKLKRIYLSLSKQYIKKDEKALFLSAIIEKDRIRILDKQESHMLKSFAEADAIIYMPEGKKIYNIDNKVEAHLLNN